MVKVARLEVSEKKGFRVVLKGLRCPGIVRSQGPIEFLEFLFLLFLIVALEELVGLEFV